MQQCIGSQKVQETLKQIARAKPMRGSKGREGLWKTSRQRSNETRTKETEARGRDFSFNQEVNLEAKKSLWACLLYLVGGAKHQPGSKGNLHLANLTGMPAAMT